jgi:hypothetical protein
MGALARLLTLLSLTTSANSATAPEPVDSQTNTSRHRIEWISDFVARDPPIPPPGTNAALRSPSRFQLYFKTDARTTEM